MADQFWIAAYPWIHLVGRILFSALFIMLGMGHFAKSKDMTAYAAAKGVPAPKAAVSITGAMILVGGVLVLLGWHRFIGAGLIVLFTVSSAFTMHAFWKETDPATMQNEMAHFLKDLALAGGALFIAYHSGMTWPMSLGG